MTPRRLAAACAVAGLALGGLAGCAGDSTGAAGSSPAYISENGSIVLLQQQDRAPAPEISGTTLTGEPYSLAAQRGHVVVLNVWASWCAPCRGEAPDLVEVADATAKQGVNFVGLVTRDSEASARAFVDKFGIPYPNVLDRDGALQLKFRDSLPTMAIPSTLLIDQQGRVAGRVLGPVTAATLTDLVDQLAAE